MERFTTDLENLLKMLDSQKETENKILEDIKKVDSPTNDNLNIDQYDEIIDKVITLFEKSEKYKSILINLLNNFKEISILHQKRINFITIINIGQDKYIIQLSRKMDELVRYLAKIDSSKETKKQISETNDLLDNISKEIKQYSDSFNKIYNEINP